MGWIRLSRAYNLGGMGQSTVATVSYSEIHTSYDQHGFIYLRRQTPPAGGGPHWEKQHPSALATVGATLRMSISPIARPFRIPSPAITKNAPNSGCAGEWPCVPRVLTPLKTGPRSEAPMAKPGRISTQNWAAGAPPIFSIAERSRIAAIPLFGSEARPARTSLTICLVAASFAFLQNDGCRTARRPGHGFPVRYAGGLERVSL